MLKRRSLCCPNEQIPRGLLSPDWACVSSPQFMCSVCPCAQHRPSLLYQSFPVGSLPALFCSWKQKQTNSLCHWCYSKSLWPKEISWNKINQSWASQSSKNWARETACSVKVLAYHFQSPGFGPQHGQTWSWWHTPAPQHSGERWQ